MDILYKNNNNSSIRLALITLGILALDPHNYIYFINGVHEESKTHGGKET